MAEKRTAGGSLKKHEMLGLFYQFLGATSIGIGIYLAAWFALRPLYYKNLAFSVQGGEWLLFPLFFGVGGILWSLGKIELKDAQPANKR